MAETDKKKRRKRLNFSKVFPKNIQFKEKKINLNNKIQWEFILPCGVIVNLSSSKNEFEKKILINETKNDEFAHFFAEILFVFLFPPSQPLYWSITWLERCITSFTTSFWKEKKKNFFKFHFIGKITKLCVTLQFCIEFK